MQNPTKSPANATCPEVARALHNRVQPQTQQAKKKAVAVFKNETRSSAGGKHESGRASLGNEKRAERKRSAGEIESNVHRMSWKDRRGDHKSARGHQGAGRVGRWPAGACAV